MSFNLLYEPWLPVVDLKGRTREVGLREVLLEAHELRWLDGEAPIVTAALHRLLLALMHRVYGPKDADRWEELWDADGLPEKEFHEYADAYADRFDLFGKRPFFQTPGIPEDKIGSAAKLTLYRATGNNATLFDHTTSDEHVELEPADAARWLVTLQSYDTGGMKTPLVRDKSSEKGICNRFAMVLVEGQTLKQTLLLNTVLYSPAWQWPPSTGRDDAPVWEPATSLGPEPVREGPAPKGWTQLLTWPSRRILLRSVRREDGIKVDGVALLPGTRLPKVDLHKIEQMAAFYREKRKGKGKKIDFGPYRPVELEALRGVWRHARELLLPVPSHPERMRVPVETDRIRPRVLDHVANMRPTEAVHTLRVFGQRLDKQGGGSVTSWMQETVPAPVALLRADEHVEQLGPLLGHAVELAEDLGEQLSRLEREYAMALGAQEERRGPKRRMLVQWYWPALEAPFGVLLRELGTKLRVTPPGQNLDRDVLAFFDSWRDAVRRCARDARNRWVRDTPRISAREELALAACDNEYHLSETRLCTKFDLEVRTYWPSEESRE